jgi:hypothetical protein
MVLHMKGQEKLRWKIMGTVKRKLKTLKAAALELGISYSQAKRIYRRYLAGGDEAPGRPGVGTACRRSATLQPGLNWQGLTRHHVYPDRRRVSVFEPGYRYAGAEDRRVSCRGRP